MNLYCIEFEAGGMAEEAVADELNVMDETLRAIGGGLLGADRHHSPGRWLGRAHAESGQALRDVFEASDFAVVRVDFIGPSHGAHRLGQQGGRKSLGSVDIAANSQRSPSFSLAGPSRGRGVIRPN